MTGQVVRPHGRPPLPLLPLIVVVGVWGAIGVAGLVWVCGRTASVLSGHGWNNGEGLGPVFLGNLFRGRWELLWPHVPTALVAVLSSVIATGMTAIVIVANRLLRRRRAFFGAARALAGLSDIHRLTPAAVMSSAAALRSSLVKKATDARQTGLFIGNLIHQRAPLRASWEDVLVAIMGPRTGKTTALAVPAVIDAPGAVIATGNKSDLWAATSSLRAQHGQVWLFDPQAITSQPQQWWWNPLAGVSGIADARKLADHFVQQMSSGKERDFWALASHDLLACLFLAAAVHGGSLSDVYGWLNDSATPAPAVILRQHGFGEIAEAHEGRQNGAPETRDGIYENARTAAACLADAGIMSWVVPRADLPQFHTRAFVTSTDTIYLLSHEDKSGPAPLIAAMTEAIFTSAQKAAQTQGGRLDPPMVAVLDEAANVCKIANLPSLYSHLGSRGIIPITILQSYQQGVGVWGATGMGALWSAATCKVIGPGIDDAQFAERLSTLVGDYDVSVASFTSHHHGGGGSDSMAVRRQRILSAADIRALPIGSALLLAAGCKPALLELVPWYKTSRAASIRNAIAEAESAITAAARQGGVTV